MRKLIQVISIVLIILIVCVVIFVLMIDPLAKVYVEKSTAYALKVDTSLEEIDVGLLDGKVCMNKLTIGNPEGFETPYFMKTGVFDLKIEPKSIFSRTIEVDRFILDGLDINIEHKLTESNLSRILKNLKRLSSDEEKGVGKRDGKQYRINKIVIENVTAHFYIRGKSLSTRPVTVKIPKIVLNDVSSEESGLAIAEVVAKILPAILVEVVRRSEGLVPSDVVSDFRSQLVGFSEVILPRKVLKMRKVKLFQTLNQSQKGVKSKHKLKIPFLKIIPKTSDKQPDK